MHSGYLPSVPREQVEYENMLTQNRTFFYLYFELWTIHKKRKIKKSDYFVTILVKTKKNFFNLFKLETKWRTEDDHKGETKSQKH